MKIYRYIDHYEVVDGSGHYIINYTITQIKKIGEVRDGFAPSGGSLVQNPIRQLLFPVISLVKRCRDDLARTSSSTPVTRTGSAARQK